MKNYFIFILICIVIISMQSCDPFVRPTGKWTCEELQISLEFEYDGIEAAKGTIVIDGSAKEIVCLIGSGGAADICYPDIEHNYPAERYNLYTGYFDYKGKDKMILVIMKPGKSHAVTTDEKYTFTKEDQFHGADPKTLCAGIYVPTETSAE